MLRRRLAAECDLGEYGAQAIQGALPEEVGTEHPLPSVATINRILKQNGCFDGRVRMRRKPPPSGWYLPEVAERHAEIDETDFVEDLAIEGGPTVFVLNTISLHGGWCASWPTTDMRARFVKECLRSHWQAFGLPDYAQFDNGSVFYGTHGYCDVVGSVTRICLSLGVTPIFAVPREFGIQSSIESYNNRWQQKVWQRFHVSSLDELKARSDRYVMAARLKQRQRFDAAPTRRPFPTDWSEPSKLERSGRILLIRRTNQEGAVHLLGHHTQVSATWCNRLVRCEVDLAQDVIRVYGLRRQDPTQQNLLAQWPYRLPDKRAEK